VPVAHQVAADAFIAQKKTAPAAFDSTGLPNKVLHEGAHETAVAHVQAGLEKLGFMTRAEVATGPGWFGKRTMAALKQFQARHHLPVTGAFDARTHAAMHAALAPHAPVHPAPQPHPAPHPVPKPPTHTPVPPTTSLGTVPHGEAAQYAFFKKFVAAQGGTFQTGPNRINLVGLRRDNRVGAGGGAYHDVVYAVYTDSKGVPHSKRFTYTTEPAHNMAWDAGDSNGDGRPDQGRIPNGHFTYSVSHRSNGAPCLRPAKNFVPERDVNHDGSFSEHFRSGDGSVFLFHQGGNYETGSAGCQTFKPSEWSRFWNTVKQAHGTLTYTLTTTVPKNA
jgi:hypothetical protein